MNLLISVGYITKVKYYKDTNKLTFRLWHKKDHFLYCYTSSPELIRFILDRVDKGNFVTIEGRLHDYTVKINDYKVRKYCVIIQDIQFMTPFPDKQFDIHSNPAYRNWRMLDKKIVKGENFDERIDYNDPFEEGNALITK